jgi:hypothetical protein
MTGLAIPKEHENAFYIPKEQQEQTLRSYFHLSKPRPGLLRTPVFDR